MHALVCAPNGTKIRAAADADKLVGHAFLGVELVALPVARLDEEFFAPKTQLAGKIMQKSATCRMSLAGIGDISRHLDNTLQALVRENNVGKHICFLPDMAALYARLQTDIHE